MIPYFMDIYWIILNRDYTYYEDNCYGYVMPRERSIDIDSKMDFMIADMHIKKIIDLGKYYCQIILK